MADLDPFGWQPDGGETPGGELDSSDPIDGGHQPLLDEPLLNGGTLGATHPALSPPGPPNLAATGAGPNPFDGVGDPLADALAHEQQVDQVSCSVSAQRLVIESLTGVDIPEAQLLAEAQEGGYWIPGHGTPLNRVGDVLDLHGIATTRGYGGDLGMAWDALARGDRVIVDVDAMELTWPQDDPITGAPLEQPGTQGHTVVLSGLDPNPDGSLSVLISDPGRADGAVLRVEVDDFMNAWGDTQRHWVIAHAPTTWTGAR